MSFEHVNLVIVNTRVANLASVDFAFRRLGITPTISADPAVIKAASHVVLPGVGTAGAAMRSLESLGLVPVLQALTQPVLGICLGMQMLTERSAEVGKGSLIAAQTAKITAAAESYVNCIGVIPGSIERMQAAANMPLPHMGWNETSTVNEQGEQHPIFKGLTQPWFYYVHSFAAPIGSSTIATCEYSMPFSAAIAHNNFIGVQFHPERSGVDGAHVLQNFLEFSC
ncbi:glutamine amidotransferase-related protein [Aliidiomarina sp.]|uniref:glutamine amidotransferase-related protein n=1 Tax=Aliidiomarina sp. TaxID=1872439 RepID=UPI003A4D6192